MTNMEADSNKIESTANARGDERPSLAEIPELERSLKELQEVGGRYCIPFANDILVKADKIKAIRRAFNLQIECIELNERELVAYEDRCLVLFKCYAIRDEGKFRIVFNDVLTCTACGAENDPEATCCAECGRSFDELRAEEKRLIEDCEKQSKKLKLELAKVALDEAEQNEAIRAAIRGDNLSSIEENLRKQKEIISRIDELRELAKEKRRETLSFDSYEFVVCGSCGKKQDKKAAFCSDCGSSISISAAKRACPKCRVLYMGDIAYCMYCGSQTVEIFQHQRKGGSARTCPNCGASVVNGKRFCTKCGTRIEGMEG